MSGLSYRLLSDLCEIRSGGTPLRSNPEFYGGSLPWAKISDFDAPNGIITQTEEYLTDDGLKAIRGRVFPKGTLLFAIYGSIGKMAFAGTDLTTNQAILGINPKPGAQISSHFLYYWLQAQGKKLASDGVGVTQKNLSAEYIRNLILPLPPLDEQRRIAAILDKADAIRRKRQQALALADDFLRSAFLEMFGDPVTNPKGFAKGTVRDLISRTQYGTSAKASASQGKFPILRMGNLTFEGGWNLDELKYIDLAEHEVEKFTVRKGDILFNRTNSKELVGKTAVFEEENPYAFAGYLVRARTNEKANPYYISGYLNSRHGKETLRGMCKSIIGMANINAQEFLDIPILLPPIDIQNAYQSLVKRTQESQKKMCFSRNEANTLFSSLSQRAFRGEL